MTRGQGEPAREVTREPDLDLRYGRAVRPILSREQMRAFDVHAIEACRVPSLVLMENAGRGAAERIRQRLRPDERVVVVCGRGNNGGDGFVVARHFDVWGHPVEVFLLGGRDALTGDARANADAWVGVGGRLSELPEADARFEAALASAACVVDALFGTGLDRELRGEAATTVERINRCSARVFSLDLPSGLDANAGRALGSAVRAEATFTFAHLKLGLVNAAARAFTGDVEVVDLGVPASLVDAVGASAWCTEPADAKRLLAMLPRPRHKGDQGRILILAGAPGTVGAARLSAHGAHRGGAGLVRVASFGRVVEALEATSFETMTAALDEANPAASLDPLLDWASVVVAGPGFGTSAPARAALRHVVARAKVPIVLDADGLNAFAGEAESLRAAERLLITPHPGEAARLLGSTVADVEADRPSATRRLREATGATVLLKGERTLVTRGADLVVNPTGGPALSAGGSGDVLSGLLGALGQHLELPDAAVLGAWLLGRAAETLDGGRVASGALAREIADRFPALMSELASG